MADLSESRSLPADDAWELQRLRWQCRRGMLKLDQLLERFLDLGCAKLSADEQQDFLALLGEPDPLLSDWSWGVPSRPSRVCMRWWHGSSQS
ncbi:MAG: FAD assembly factor SdhE [Thermochromatium sp.]